MKHVLWIGGPPASGKTTIATRLARRHGLRLYSADTRTWIHRDRALAAGNAAARRWESRSPDERWEQSTVAEMLDMSLHRERGPMVLDDLHALPASPLIVAEGSTLPASAISSGIADRSRAVWLLPTAAFQAARLAANGTTGGPADLYRALRAVIEREAAEHGVPTLVVDGTRDISAMAEAVERQFAEPIAAGPRAETARDCRSLLREMNAAIVTQVHGYYARPWAAGDPGAVIKSFVCECGDPECDRSLVLTVREAATGPVLAPDHAPRA